MQETIKIKTRVAGVRCWEVKDIVDAWDFLVEAVSETGDKVSPRDMATRELTNVAMEYTGPYQYEFRNPVRKLNQFFHVAELFYFLNGRDDDLLLDYVPAMVNYINPYTNRFDGSYGPALYHGLPKAINLLQQDKDSRRAVVPILRLNHLDPSSLDIPCNDLLALRIRDNRLDMNIVTRSQDLYRGFLYDTMEFQLLQFMLARAMHLRVGTYGHYLFSLHLYEKDIENAEKAVGHTEQNIGEPNFMWLHSVEEFWKLCRNVNKTLDNKEKFKKMVRSWNLIR